MNYVQPQAQMAPQPQQVQPPMMQQPQVQQQPQPQQQVQPQQVQQVQQPQPMMQQPQQVQPQQQAQMAAQPQGAVSFYGADLNPQDAQVVNQVYSNACQSLGLQLNDSATVSKSLYFGARDFFKTIYVNQVSLQRGESPKTPDYEAAQSCFENTFGTVGKLRVTELQLCCTLKAIAPTLLPNLTSGAEPHVHIRNYILDHNWHSQNTRQNSGGISRNNGTTNVNGMNPFATGGAQSKAAAAAGFAPQVGFVPQQTAQAVMGAMPTYR